jgi:hypothetical protein
LRIYIQGESYDIFKFVGLFDTSRRHGLFHRSLLTSSDVFDIDMLPCPVGGSVEAALADSIDL